VRDLINWIFPALAFVILTVLLSFTIQTTSPCHLRVPDLKSRTPLAHSNLATSRSITSPKGRSTDRPSVFPRLTDWPFFNERFIHPFVSNCALRRHRASSRLETEPINYNPLPRGIHDKSNGTSWLCVEVEGSENESGE